MSTNQEPWQNNLRSHEELCVASNFFPKMMLPSMFKKNYSCIGNFRHYVVAVFIDNGITMSLFNNANRKRGIMFSRGEAKKAPCT